MSKQETAAPIVLPEYVEFEGRIYRRRVDDLSIERFVPVDKKEPVNGLFVTDDRFRLWEKALLCVVLLCAIVGAVELVPKLATGFANVAYAF